MARSPSDIAIKNLSKLIAKDPLLRDIVNPILPAARRTHQFTPDVDVYETADAWKVILDVPGIQRGDLNVTLDGARLVVTGLRRPSVEGVKAKVRERAAGRFEREFLVPSQVDPARIGARLESGVLTVTLPRATAADRRSVDIE